MSDFSDLTDFDDDEDGSLASQRSKGKGKKSGSAYKIQGALRAPRATTYTCQALYDQIHAQDIDLQPEYQRDVVWTEVKQMGLIDSIFRNFYIPPVIFVVNTMDDGGERRVCVDGKQRLTSIYRFLAGEIYFKDTFTSERFVFKDTGKIKAQMLPDHYKKIFLNKQIVCMEYSDISADSEREIFRRVQLGMALTPAEKLQAITGPQADFVRSLLDQYVSDELANNLPWDTSRANDFRGLAMAVYAMSRWPKVTTIPSLAVIETWLQERGELDEEFQEDIHNTYRIFCEMAKDTTLKKPFWMAGIKKVAPMEVMAITLLIHANKRKMTMAQLSEAIAMMRKDIRTTEKDIRQNSRMMKIILAFLKDLKVSNLKPDPKSPKAIEYPSVGTKTKTKRKRHAASDSDDDDEFRPSPALRLPASNSSQRPPSAANHPSIPPSPRPPPTAPAALRAKGLARPNIPPPPQFSGNLGSSSQANDTDRDPRYSSYQLSPRAGQTWSRR